MANFTLNAYSMVFSEHVMAKQLELSNKILISASVLPDIDMSHGTVIFKLEKDGTEIYCGMHEYVDSPGLCFVPHKYLSMLKCNVGDAVTVSQVTDLPKGDYIKIKPFETAFIQLANPKAVLEKFIVKGFPVLTQGEIITIKYLDHDYEIEIVETKPNPIIKTIDCDINLDFDEPYDYEEKKEEERKPSPPPRPESPPDPRFPGVGRRLGTA